MSIDSSQTAASTYRGGIVESTHRAHIAVVRANGQLLHAFNDPHRLTLVRSAAKPAQALAVIGTGALERFGFDEGDLALMCGSNSSEARHIERARSMLAKVGEQETAMRCGGHAPLSDTVWRDWIRRGFEPTPVCSNCSGKHVGMLAAARAMGAPTDDYHAAGHPLQQHVKHTVAEVCDLPDDAVQWGIDGCNLPTPAFPLDRLARLYAKLAHAADSDADALGARDQALARIYRAMTAHPELVAGEQRFCTTLMRAFGGDLIGKVGADGSYAIGVRERAAGNAEEAIGIAVKVEDGNLGALYAIVVAVLRELGIGSTEQLAALRTFDRPSIRNSVGVETGYLEVRGDLLKA